MLADSRTIRALCRGYRQLEGLAMTEPLSGGNLLEVNNLKVYFPVHAGLVFQQKVADIKAVDGVSFHVERGETLGLVGESGCGKTTLGRAILRLYDITGGEVIFEGRDLTSLPRKQLRPVRRKMQIIFQDPYSSLNSRRTCSDIIGEGLVIHKLTANKSEYRERVDSLLRVVGLDSEMGNRYPHEFSGGQRQRIGIARALAVEPKFVVCDEPVSALDVSIQAQIINLLRGLQNEFDLTYLFIAHDLSVVRHISNRVAVMYLGHITEITSRDELYVKPLHPYTRALLSAVPIPDPVAEAQWERVILKGELPSPMNPPSGCVFRTRCLQATEECAHKMPELREVNPNHWAACIHVPGYAAAADPVVP